MHIQTFSIVVGTKACDAHCPFCISRMTGYQEVSQRLNALNEVNFDKACKLADKNGANTVLLTGKGEPTLYPGRITNILERLGKYSFPLIELQTNALRIGHLANDAIGAPTILTHQMLQRWHSLGLNTIAISTAGIDPELNAKIYHKDYPDLVRTVRYLRDIGFTIRLGVMLMQENIEQIPRILEFCCKHDIDQTTFRPIRRPEASDDDSTSAFVRDHGITPERESQMYNDIRSRGKKLMTLMHGAEVWDLDGRNVCLTDCLTQSTDTDDIRTLILYENGRLTYDWQYEGAVLLSGTR